MAERRRPEYDRAGEAADWIADRAPGPYEAAIVLGSGLGALADRLAGAIPLPYAEIPHFPTATVVGHAGRLLVGRLAGARVLVFLGRFHAYEGHGLDAVTFPVRVTQRLGVPRLILTAATGGLRSDLGPGSIVGVSDHLNLLGANPLRGPNDERFGPRFPDLTAVYSGRLRALAQEVAAGLGPELPEGVYACLPGPSYETPAEVRMLRALGADVVGMSTVPEAIVARHGGQEVAAFAVVSNWAAGLGDGELSHAEVLEVGRGAGGRLADLIEGVLGRVRVEGAGPGESPPGGPRADQTPNDETERDER